MDAPQRTRRVNRDKSEAPSQVRGAKQIVVPMTREQYDARWSDASQVRALLDELLGEFPEIFPENMRAGYALHGHGRESRKLPGVRLRKLKLADGSIYWLRPSFALSYMAGTVEDLAYPLLLAAHGVPTWLLTHGFGHSDMFWQRVIERLGRSSLVGSTVRDPARLPEHLTADEHHGDWAGEKGFLAMTAAEGCVLGLALTKSADEQHLQAAYAEFAREARDVKPDYAPQTVNTDGWAATQNAFRALFPAIAVVLCYLHGFLKIRDRCRKNHDLHRRVWEVFRAPTAAAFRQQMCDFQEWWEQQSFPAAVREMLTKLAKKTEHYAVAYDHPGCRRTSNAVDRPMNRLTRLLYAGRGLHGHQASSERRLRGWALLVNFRPYVPRSNHPRDHDSPAHRLNGKRYHNHWLHNLCVSTSQLGFRKPAPAIR